MVYSMYNKLRRLKRDEYVYTQLNGANYCYVVPGFFQLINYKLIAWFVLMTFAYIYGLYHTIITANFGNLLINMYAVFSFLGKIA